MKLVILVMVLFSSCSYSNTKLELREGDIVEHKFYKCMGVVDTIFSSVKVALVNDYVCEIHDNKIKHDMMSRVSLDRLYIVTSIEQTNKYHSLLEKALKSKK